MTKIIRPELDFEAVGRPTERVAETAPEPTPPAQTETQPAPEPSAQPAPAEPAPAAPTQTEAPATPAPAGGVMIGGVDVGKEVTDALSGLQTTLNGVTDAATAQAAAPQLQTASSTFDRIGGPLLGIFPLLDGFRGAPKADVAALEEIILRVGTLADHHPAIAEMDCNPVAVLPSGAVIVDARVRVQEAPPHPPLAARGAET